MSLKGKAVRLGARLQLLLLLSGWSAGQVSMPVRPDDFPPVPKQFSVKVEMVIPDEKLVEEFMMYWDEELNLTRFDYALGKIMAPYNTSRPMKTIHDFGNGVSFNMDGTLPNCSMSPLGYLLTDATVTAPIFRPRKFLLNGGNMTINQLLRALDPRQLFYLNPQDRVHNTTNKEIHRGIPCEIFSVLDNDFYIPGYGKSRVRHKLYFMSKEFARSLVGETPYMIPVQRTTSFNNLIGTTSSPKIIFNFFDFTVPPVPTLYDFSISQCIPKTKTEMTRETRESIQIRFPGNFSGFRIDQFIPQFRRAVLKRILAVGDLSPLRVVGMFPSQDAQNVYITATVLPRPPAQLLFVQMLQGVRGGAGGRAYTTAVDLPAEQLNTCAKLCTGVEPVCQKFAWCKRDDGTGTSRKCALRYGQESPARGEQVARMGELENYTCDVYQKIVNNSDYEGAVIDSLFKILLEVQDGNFTVALTSKTGNTVTLKAEDMRTDVSLGYEDTATPSTTDSRSAFDFYRAQSIIVNAAAKDQFSKLSPAECRRHCLDEKRFTCHSVASCVHGDCVISDLHGDELMNTTNGQQHLQSHTHCVVWTRSWKGMFTLASLLLPESSPDMVISGVSNEDTCAKQCLFNNFTCESFAYCSSATPQSPKGTRECQLFKSHAFDTMNEERVHKQGCWHLSRNYVQDFEASPGFELITDEKDMIKADIEPALERWQCAKECIDKLGDDGCLAFDICEENAADPDILSELDLLTSETENVLTTPAKITCRISSAYIGARSNSVKRIRANENCTLYSRTTYLDGTHVNSKTVGALQQRNPEKGYTISDMAGLAVGILIIGVVSAANDGGSPSGKVKLDEGS
ncbi:hypothetical protein BV898_12467 [Hypsibius exemplaris]|uniref:Apple domain-containing protein n=1 Tax=Hypsibius exemplaris TaxID=2072580 RepID=A0A1W0WDI1_HYPEX|nr:hypothetical protein BV898_12467 [Hypsibius exemplaris]